VETILSDGLRLSLEQKNWIDKFNIDFR